MRVEKVVPGVYRLGLRWSNVYLLVDEDSGEAALIDTGLASDRDRILEGMAEVGVSQAALRQIYLTHAHCDHAGNALFFASGASPSPGCPPARVPINISEIEALYLSGERRSYAPSGFGRLLRPAMSFVMASAERSHPIPRCRADRALADGDLVDAPGGPLRVVLSPGHSPGHASFFREADRLLFSGDAILNIDIKKRVGLGIPIRPFCENHRQARRSAILLAKLRPSALLSGHGPALLADTERRVTAFARSLKS